MVAQVSQKALDGSAITRRLSAGGVRHVHPPRKASAHIRQQTPQVLQKDGHQVLLVPSYHPGTVRRPSSTATLDILPLVSQPTLLFPPFTSTLRSLRQPVGHPNLGLALVPPKRARCRSSRFCAASR